MQAPTVSERILLEWERSVLMRQIEELHAQDPTATERQKATERARSCQIAAIDASNAFYRVGVSNPYVVDAKLVRDAIKKAERYRKDCTR